MILPIFLVRSLALVLFVGALSTAESYADCSKKFNFAVSEYPDRLSSAAIRSASLEDYWKNLEVMAGGAKPAVKITINSYFFQVEDLEVSGLIFEGQVKDRRLILYVYSRENEVRSKILHAQKLYSIMMNHFEQSGVMIDSIEGYWNRLSDNQRQFREARQLGLSRNAAVFKTWSGRQAESFGFTRIKNFRWAAGIIRVTFVRPSSAERH